MVKHFVTLGAPGLCAVVVSLSAFACDPRCSDGFVELELCEQDAPDDAATPGDERPGYLTCVDAETGASDSCGPGSGCCGGGAQCATDAEQCELPAWFATCDGPEDCAADEQCWLDERSVQCSAESTPSLHVRCHSDLDCREPDENPCVNGYCLGDPDSSGEPVAG